MEVTYIILELMNLSICVPLITSLTVGGALGISDTYHVKDFHANREGRPQEGCTETDLQYERVQASKVGQTLL